MYDFINRVKQFFSNKNKIFKNKMMVLTAMLLIIAGAADLGASFTQMFSGKNLSNLMDSNVFGAVNNLGALSKDGAQVGAGVKLADISSYSSNGAQVQSYPVQNSKGTVILIPQLHLYPGSSPSDKTNDNAVVAQNQIAQIITDLNKKYGVNMVMVEGELAGPVSDQKINDEKDKINEIQSLTQDISQLQKDAPADNLNSGLIDSTVKSLQDQVSQAQRAVVLFGAPFELKAQGMNLDLYGAETKSTYDASANLVRQYLYLQDRINQLQQSPAGLSSNGLGSLGVGSNLGSGGSIQNMILQMLTAKQRSIGTGNNSDSQGIYQMLSQYMGSGNSLQKSLAYLSSSASQQNDSSLANLVSSISGTLTDLQKPIVPPNTNAPSRADNPYANITNVNTLQQMLKDTENKMNDLVLNQRSLEATKNFAAALKDGHASAGILTFGAGHEDSLVKDFNNEGISVIVITPQEVAASAQASS